MKKLLVSLLVFSLALSPVFSLGNREVGLKTIFLKDSTEVTQSLIEKPIEQSSPAKKLAVNSTESKSSQKSSVEEIKEMSDEEVITEIVTTAGEANEINQALFTSLAMINSENTRMAEEIAENDAYINTLETDLEKANKSNQDKDIELAEKEGKIDTLNEKLKAKKSYKTLLVGADYNLVDGYSVGLDFGVKFNGGLTTQVGVKAPLDALNPVGVLDINNYTFSTKIGWSW